MLSSLTVFHKNPTWVIFLLLMIGGKNEMWDVNFCFWTEAGQKKLRCPELKGWLNTDDRQARNYLDDVRHLADIQRIYFLM